MDNHLLLCLWGLGGLYLVLHHFSGSLVGVNIRRDPVMQGIALRLTALRQALAVVLLAAACLIVRAADLPL
jgi:hypothetical protein